MFRMVYAAGLIFVAAGGLIAQPALAETPAQVLAEIESTAKTTPGFQGFSAARGEQFFKTTHGNELRCAGCHTENPADTGKHAKTGKPIEPIAPIANPKRFTDMSKVEKWFKRNCNDVLERPCTAQEKGDFLTYLLSIRK